MQKREKGSTRRFVPVDGVILQVDIPKGSVISHIDNSPKGGFYLHHTLPPESAKGEHDLVRIVLFLSTEKEPHDKEGAEILGVVESPLGPAEVLIDKTTRAEVGQTIKPIDNQTER